MGMRVLPMSGYGLESLLNSSKEGFLYNTRVESRNYYWFSLAAILPDVIVQSADVSLISQYPGYEILCKPLSLLRPVAIFVES